MCSDVTQPWQPTAESGPIRVKRPGSTRLEQAVEAALALEVASLDAHSPSFDLYSASDFPTIGRRSLRHVGDGLESMLDLQPRPEFSEAHLIGLTKAAELPTSSGRRCSAR